MRALRLGYAWDCLRWLRQIMGFRRTRILSFSLSLTTNLGGWDSFGYNYIR